MSLRTNKWLKPNHILWEQLKKITQYNEKRTVIHVTGAPARETASLGPTFKLYTAKSNIKNS